MIPVAHADCLRCGEQMVCERDSKADIIAKCGPPDYSDLTSVVESYGVTSKIEVFYYNCGEGRYVHTLTFRGSTLIKIRATNSHGTGPQRCF
jgi:hypothetical protein